MATKHKLQVSIIKSVAAEISDYVSGVEEGSRYTGLHCHQQTQVNISSIIKCVFQIQENNF